MSNVLYYTVGDDLSHHGIEGQKWGQRNGPPYPLGASDHSSAEKKAGTKGWSKEAKQENKKKGAAKENGSQTSKAKDGKSNIYEKHREKLISEYKKRGYSEVAAETATKRRIKTELIVGAVATVAAVVIIRKVGIRLGQDYCDKIIKSGATIQNIGAKVDADFQGKPFYAAINKRDKWIYGMRFPAEKQSMEVIRGRAGDIYNNSIEITKDVRRASVSTAAKILSQKMNADPAFKKEVIDALRQTPYGYYMKGGLNADVKDPKKFYKWFNLALATPEFQKAGIHEKFYSELKSKGYNAVLDLNDTRFSGYKGVVKEPTIFFGENKWAKVKSTRVDDQAIERNAGIAVAHLAGEKTLKELGIYGGAIAAVSSIINKREVEKYLDEHPNSELSEKEIKKRLKQKT